MVSLEQIIAYAKVNQCSDVHLSEGLPPYFRLNGTLYQMESFKPIDGSLISSLVSREKQNLWDGEHNLDFAVSIAGGRQRVNIFRQSGRLAMAVRLLNDHVPTLEELALPPVLCRLAEEPCGLVLVTGPTGSGKSTTLAAMINYIAATRPCHIITIEDPIEYVYRSGQSLIHQRELGRDVGSFATALRSVLREDPDVIMVGEMRDFETISAAITAAETGHLVLSTLHTIGAARTVDRIIDVFPSQGKNQIQAQLTGVLKGVITQKLLPLAKGGGRIAATEVMLANDAVQNLIREGKTYQISTIIQAGATRGMHTMEADIAALVKKGLITKDTAQANAPNPDELHRLLA
jgi:twitching motility protein PilT